MLYDSINNYRNRSSGGFIQAHYGGNPDWERFMKRHLYYSGFIKSADGGVNWVNQLGETNVAPALTDDKNAMSRFSTVSVVRYGKSNDIPDIDQADTYVYLLEGSVALVRVETEAVPQAQQG